MQPTKVTERIKAKALELLEQYPEGLRYSELHAKILEADGAFKPNTINGCIWNLDAIYPDSVYKPSKGLFRLLKNKPTDTDVLIPSIVAAVAASKVKEEDFYAPFADWLKNEIEDVTHAIPLGGNKFKDKWGTPDVIGKRESMRSDITTVSGSISPAALSMPSLSSPEGPGRHPRQDFVFCVRRSDGVYRLPEAPKFFSPQRKKDLTSGWRLARVFCCKTATYGSPPCSIVSRP